MPLNDLQFILNVRLDYRISCLLSVFKKESDDNPSSLTGDGMSQGLKNKNLENIWAQAQSIFDETWVMFTRIRFWNSLSVRIFEWVMSTHTHLWGYWENS